jgi:hypothetical protein
MAEQDSGVFKELAGMGVTAASVLLAAVVSAIRLKPYLESGQTWTPLHVTTYPALLALGAALVVYGLARGRGGARFVEVGPLRFSPRHLAVAVGCLAYVAIAIVVFS